VKPSTSDSEHQQAYGHQASQHTEDLDDPEPAVHESPQIARECLAATLLRLLRRAKLRLRPPEMLPILVPSVARVEHSLCLSELLLGFSNGDLVSHPGILTQDRDSALRYRDEPALHGDDLPGGIVFAEDHDGAWHQH